MKRRKRSSRKSAAKELRVRRSAKAGRPPVAGASPARVRRRQKRSKATLRKGTMLMQADRPPRTVWGAESPRVKKR
jgi:hypothetical protein